MEEFMRQYLAYWEDRMSKLDELDPEQQRMVRFAYSVIKEDFDLFLAGHITGNQCQNLNAHLRVGNF